MVRFRLSLSRWAGLLRPPLLTRPSLPFTAQLADNPHIRRPTRADYDARPARPTNPVFAPPPPKFRRATDPSSSAPPPSPAAQAHSSSLGQFGLSLRGVRRTLRRTKGGRSEAFVEIVEGEVVRWLGASGRITGVGGFYHVAGVGQGVGRVVDATPMVLTSGAEVAAVVELERSPAALVWRVADPFDRYVLHALCRYYHLQSSSHEEAGRPESRLTRVWRPHVARPTVASALRGLDTPPGTDLSDLGTSGSELGLGESELELDTETDLDGHTTDGEDWSQVDEQEGGWRAAEVGRPAMSRLSTTEFSLVDADDDARSVASGPAVSTDDEFASDGAVDSLVSSIASLPAIRDTALSQTPRHASSSGPHGTPRASLSAATAATPPAFVPFAAASPSPSGNATPTRAPRGSGLGASGLGSRLAGRSAVETDTDVTDAESERSRSPSREGRGVGVVKGWDWPARGFGDFVFGEE